MAEDLDPALVDYVLGTLRGDERLDFEARLENDPALRAKIDYWEKSLIALDLSAPQQRPESDLFANILNSIDAETPLQETLVSDRFTRRAGTGIWEEMSPGVTFQILYDDPVSKRRSMLIRMEPGSIYAAHNHGKGHEECLVLEGDFEFEDCKLFAGDFHVASISSVHSTARTIAGCLLHISTAL